MRYEHPRIHVRIHYPPSRRPVLLLAGIEHAVLDLSAEGLLFQLPAGVPFPDLGSRLEGVLRLRSCPPVDVRARVVWVDEDRVGLHLWPDAIPYPLLLAEERSLAPNRES
jgi:hypothetical protein